MKSITYNGLDLLKFIMALFVVMIHVKPNAHSEILTAMLNPIMSIAVPVFFVLSSVLIFNKLTNVNGGVFVAYKIWQALGHSVFLLAFD